MIRRLAVEVVSFVSGLIRFGIIENLRELPSHVVITPPYHMYLGPVWIPDFQSPDKSDGDPPDDLNSV